MSTYGLLAIVGVIQSLLFAAHYVVYRTFLRFIPIENLFYKRFFGISMFLLALFFPVMSVITSRFFNVFTMWLYRISAVWLGTFQLLLMACVVLWVLFFTAKLFHASPTILHYPAITLIIASICLSAYGVINSFSPTVTAITVKITNLPNEWKNKRIVFLADTHFGQIRTSHAAKNFTQLIEAQHPELVLIAGDFYDGPQTDFTTPAQLFGNIKSTYGTYLVTGNHEEYAPQGEYKAAIKASTIKFIDDQAVDINGLSIVGLGYENNHTAEQIKTTLERLNIPAEKPSIMIKHVPLHVQTPAALGIDLQLYGHSHNGQVFPNNLIAKKVFNGYNYGLKAAGDGLVYTTSGLGTWGPPQRIGTKAEIVVITLE